MITTSWPARRDALTDERMGVLLLLSAWTPALLTLYVRSIRSSRTGRMRADVLTVTNMHGRRQ